MRGLKLRFLMVSILGAFLWPGMPLAQDATFGPSIRVDDADTSSWGCYSPTLAVDRDSNIYVAWHDLRNNQGWEKWADVYFSSSFDGGATWSENVMVNDGTTPNTDLPCLDVDARGNLYLAWDDEWWGNIYFSMSQDSGESWSSNVRVNDAPGHSYGPSLAVDDSGNVYVTWSDNRSDIGDIYFSKSTDAGTTWTPNMQVNHPSNDLQVFNPIALDEEGNIYVAWSDFRDSRSNIYFAKSIDSGATWTTSVRVNNVSERHSGRPSIAVDKGGHIYVVWQYEGSGIYFGRSTDGGTTWSTSIKVNNDSINTSYAQPQIKVDDGDRLYVVWNATLPGDTASQIRFALSSNRGYTWSDPSIRVENSTLLLPSEPCLDLGPEGIYIAFRANEIIGIPHLSEPHIYFAKGSVTGIEEEPDVRYQVLDYRLYQNWPNPFNSTTAISYQLSAVGYQLSAVSLKIYNILGQEVRMLVNKVQAPGYYSMVWDGKDNMGQDVASGIYFYRLKVKGPRLKVVKTRKLVLLR